MVDLSVELCVSLVNFRRIVGSKAKDVSLFVIFLVFGFRSKVWRF